MGLYLCVFDGDEELDGVEVGSYDDFHFFRSLVTERLEDGELGSKYPVLLHHSDCDGEWSAEECEDLARELESIASAFLKLPPVPYNSAWQERVAASEGLNAGSLYECIIDVDGKPLLDRLVGLCLLAKSRGGPILFQ